MIIGILAKFDPLLSDDVSVLIKCKPEHLHELVDLRGKDVMVQAVQPDLLPDKSVLYQRILDTLEGIKKELEREPR